MATTIGVLRNDSPYPSSLFGPGGESGLFAWAQPGNGASSLPGWTIGSGYEQNWGIVTSKGCYYLWDDGNWNIDYQLNGGAVGTLITVGGASPGIQLNVQHDGSISASQL